MAQGKDLMWYLFLIVIAYNFLDMLVTLLGVYTLGIEFEGNPVVACFIRTNPLRWLRGKIIISYILLGVGFITERLNHRISYFIMNFVLAVVIGFMNINSMIWIYGMLGGV